MSVKNIRIEDFDYPLPDERIALHPLEQRDACKLLVSDPAGRISHMVFSDLPELLKPDTLIVANETKVIRARMEFVKSSGARIEIFLLEPLNPHDYVVNFASTGSCSWVCMVGNKKRWKENPLAKELAIGEEKVLLNAILRGPVGDGTSMEVAFEWNNPAYSFAEIIEAAGNIPIPPYLKRESEDSDLSDYQTVYSHTEGSVAAPTAGLHFTPELLDRLKAGGHDFATVTLHVGAGTFQPVKSEEIGDHPMHTEWVSVSKNTIDKIIKALREGRDILAVGTTSVRTLESLPYMGMLLAEGREPLVTQWMPYGEEARKLNTFRALEALSNHLREKNLDALETTTSIMIAPGFEWRIVNRLVTNFHQPKSTLLLLVSSFLRGDWRKVYDEALGEDYRFLSYGDACFFERPLPAVELPESKSIFMRLATIAAKRGNMEALKAFEKYAKCEDSSNYLAALIKLLKAKSGEPSRINIGEGAAPLRFFIALAASTPGVKMEVDGAEGLKRRPIGPLIENLRELGADIRYLEEEGKLPLMITGKRLTGKEIEVDTSKTGQFYSALLLTEDLWDGKAILKPVPENPVSWPYIAMTDKILRSQEVNIEADWSAAAFFYEAVFMRLPEFRDGLRFSSLTERENSLQGDSRVASLFDKLGVKTVFSEDGSALISPEQREGKINGTIEWDFKDTPDLVPALAVTLAYGGIPFMFTGVAHLRGKESDRVKSLVTELGKLGFELKEGEDQIEFEGRRKFIPRDIVEIDTHGDHRIAMAFAPLEVLGEAIVKDHSVVGKSFPKFWTEI